MPHLASQVRHRLSFAASAESSDGRNGVERELHGSKFVAERRWLQLAKTGGTVDSSLESGSNPWCCRRGIRGGEVWRQRDSESRNQVSAIPGCHPSSGGLSQSSRVEHGNRRHDAHVRCAKTTPTTASADCSLIDSESI